MRATWLLLLMLLSPAAITEEPQAASRLSGLLSADQDESFARVLSVREFAFPEDHGPHPQFRNEWWYITGNLDGPGGRRFGFELTIFRFSLTPLPPEADSAWRTNQVY
ncbi:MAG: lipocalin-like domain-containing protein, partial [Woeseiaceae bacterium]|nr:lipocalin-like domain-containing protein [Woeseiaceae bacterium]